MTIANFRDQYEFLSNFYPCKVEFEGETYPSAEHAYQAAKTLNLKVRKVFLLPGMNAGMSKHLGSALTLRPQWDNIKLMVMAAILKSKFQDLELAEMLVATGDAELIEGNTWGDTFWGVCDGKGQNFLGKLLMQLREDLRKHR